MPGSVFGAAPAAAAALGQQGGTIPAESAVLFKRRVPTRLVAGHPLGVLSSCRGDSVPRGGTRRNKPDARNGPVHLTGNGEDSADRQGQVVRRGERLRLPDPGRWGGRIRARLRTAVRR